MSNTKLEQAARLHDPVEHSQALLGAVLGVLAAVAVGVALAVFFPVTFAALAGATLLSTALFMGDLAATMSSMGEWIASTFLPKQTCDGVRTGAPTVTVGGRELNAARVEDEVECHSETIISGTKTITIETKLATRAEEETRCGGKLKKDACCPTVFYGGPSEKVDSVRLSGELPMWFWTAREVMGVISARGAIRTFFSPKTLRRLVSPTSWRALFRLKGALRGGIWVFNSGLEVADWGIKGYEVWSHTAGTAEDRLRAEQVRGVHGQASTVKSAAGRYSNARKGTDFLDHLRRHGDDPFATD